MVTVCLLTGGIMIKQVIDGKTYNTETARCLATVELMGYRTDQRGRFTTNTPKKVGTTSLYENRGGAYFLVRDYDPDVSPEPDLVGQFRIHDRGVIPLKPEEALGWAESKALDPDEMFGKTGDQTGAILLRVPQTLKLAIEKSAAVAGVSTNTWLMRCAERAIASEREQKANP
jgi:hypothetical protein